MQAPRMLLYIACSLLTPSLEAITHRPEEKPFIYTKKDNPRTVKLRACPALCDVYTDRAFLYMPETINKDMRFCMWSPSTRALLALAEEKIITNYQKEPAANPLRTQEISAIHMMNGRPFVSCSDYNKLIYFDTYKPEEKKMVTSGIVNDADGKPTQGVVNFTYGITGNNWQLRDSGKKTEENDWVYQPLTYVVMAVKGNSSEFGQPGSGFAVAKPFSERVIEKIRDEDDDEEEREIQRDQYRITMIDAAAGYTFKPWLNETEPVQTDYKAVPLTTETPAFSYNGGLGEIEQNNVVLHFDHLHDRFYIGLTVTTKDTASENQGASALATAYIYNNQLIILPFMPLECLSDKSIWGAVGASKKVAVHHIANLQTSTCLPYLIVVGGQGDYETTSRSVWAIPQYQERIKRVKADSHANLPRYFSLNEPMHGTCASKQSKIQDYFGGNGNLLQLRLFTDPVEKKENTPTVDDIQFLVGGEQLPAPIVHLQMCHDAVIATVRDDAQELYYVYQSQPVFDSNGIIVGWTPWLCVRASHHPIITYSFNGDSGTGITAVHRLDKHKIKIIQHAWTGPQNKKTARPENEHIITLAEQHFTKEEAGIQNLIELDDKVSNTPVLAATGYKKIMLIEQHDLLCTKKTDYDARKTFVSSDGTLKGFDPRVHTALVLSGGALAKLGPISCVELATDGKQTWLFVSGVYGVAQLRRPDGSGACPSRDDQTFFELLDERMTFVSISDLRFVKKIMAHGTNLYVLNYQTVQAHDLLRSPRTTTIATALEYGVTAFNDCAISDGYFLLGTSHGLLHKSPDSAHFDREHKLLSQPIMQIIPGQTINIDNKYHQNIFILTGSSTRKTSQVYRLYSVYNDTHAVVAPLNDVAKKDIYKSVVNCPHLRTLFATDGALTIAALSGSVSNAAAFHILSSKWSTMQESHGFAEVENPPAVPHDADISAVLHSRINGCWMVAGNFGLHILET